jgi:hypothetical protein
MIPLWQALAACVLTGAAGYGLNGLVWWLRTQRALRRFRAEFPRPVGTDVTAPLYGAPNVTRANVDWRARWLRRAKEIQE